jgi:hypothetical protein
MQNVTEQVYELVSLWICFCCRNRSGHNFLLGKNNFLSLAGPPRHRYQQVVKPYQAPRNVVKISAELGSVVLIVSKLYDAEGGPIYLFLTIDEMDVPTAGVQLDVEKEERASGIEIDSNDVDALSNRPRKESGSLQQGEIGKLMSMLID